MHLQNQTFLQGSKYQIVRFISAGGFGCTYEAEHVMLHKKIAIKEFFVKDFCNRDEQTSQVTVGTQTKVALVSKLKKKFIEEAVALSGFNHPNIVSVSDVFEENGTAYYVMDYVDGKSIHDILKTENSLSEAKAVKYIVQIAHALKYVHDRNRLHLDIKPGNIMVDRHDNAFLIDFGTSKQYDEEAGENTSTLLGKTPGYAPLEQIGNSVQSFTPATDIYALGATLYKMLSGITPPEANILVVDDDELKPLPDNISAATCKAVRQAMQVKRKERPQNIDEFLALLDNAEARSEVNVDKEVLNNDDENTIIEVDQLSKESINEEILSEKASCLGHDYVDLGLPSGLLWATCNVGAARPEECGNYFAWGEVLPKNNYNRKNCLTFGKILGNIAGISDFDAARYQKGGNWRLPTKLDFEELGQYCTINWTSYMGMKGILMTSKKNGNNVFFPASGSRCGTALNNVGEYGNYWSSTPNEDSEGFACYFCFGSYDFDWGWGYREIGKPIRPVREKED